MKFPLNQAGKFSIWILIFCFISGCSGIIPVSNHKQMGQSQVSVPQCEQPIFYIPNKQVTAIVTDENSAKLLFFNLELTGPKRINVPHNMNMTILNFNTENITKQLLFSDSAVNITWLNSTSQPPDEFLDYDETVRIDIDLIKLGVSAGSIGTNQNFTLEVKPFAGQGIFINRKTPESLKKGNNPFAITYSPC